MLMRATIFTEAKQLIDGSTIDEKMKEKNISSEWKIDLKNEYWNEGKNRNEWKICLRKDEADIGVAIQAMMIPFENIFGNISRWWNIAK